MIHVQIELAGKVPKHLCRAFCMCSSIQIHTRMQCIPFVRIYISADIALGYIQIVI